MRNHKNKRRLRKAGIKVKAAGKARMLRHQKMRRVLAFVEKSIEMSEEKLVAVESRGKGGCSIEEVLRRFVFNDHLATLYSVLSTYPSGYQRGSVGTSCYWRSRCVCQHCK